MHSEPGRLNDPVLIRSEEAVVGAAGASEPAVDLSASSNEPDPDVAAEPPTPRDPSRGSVWARPSDALPEDASDDEVDRVLLAREFSQLLQEGERGADG